MCCGYCRLPIAPIDILYGLRSSMAQGNLYMAHRCGFTQKVLSGTLQASGFKSVATMSRGHPYFDLWAVASKEELNELSFTRSCLIL